MAARRFTFTFVGFTKRQMSDYYSVSQHNQYICLQVFRVLVIINGFSILFNVLIRHIAHYSKPRGSSL